jgi:exostosin family protein
MDAAPRRHFLILHEYATALDFGEHTLLTPHVVRGMGSNFIPIAYLPYNTGEPVPFAKRTIAASFRGSMTSELRQRLLRASEAPARAPAPHWGSGEHRQECLCHMWPRHSCLGTLQVEDSGAFHDHHDSAARAANRDRYVALLANSRVAICPRGAGASTFRFWEALAMGCVPLLISDGLVLPLEETIDWDGIVLRVAEEDVDALPEIVGALDPARLERMAADGHRIWREWFSPENWIRGAAAAVTLRR